MTKKTKPEMKPTVASLFSGILGFDEGFTKAGFEPIWCCEKDAKCQAVIRKHLPGITIYDDINSTNPRSVRRPDVLIASPPCQDFSVAGKRQSLDGVRGYLSIRCAEFINALEPSIVVCENVPGWLSAKGNAFGWFLGLLVGADTALVPAGNQKWTGSGLVIGPKRTACWSTLDSQFWGVAQRRERVFLVASPGAGCPQAILFDRTIVRWNHSSSRKKRQEIAAATGSGVAGSGESDRDTAPTFSARNKGGGGG